MKIKMKTHLMKFVLFHVALASIVMMTSSEFLQAVFTFVYGFVIVPHYFRNHSTSKGTFFAMIFVAIVFGCSLMIIAGCQEKIIFVYFVVMVLQYPLNGMIRKK